MLLINARVGPSSIQGLGLIAQQFIPTGTIVWSFVAGFDVEIPESFLQSLSEPARARNGSTTLNTSQPRTTSCFPATMTDLQTTPTCQIPGNEMKEAPIPLLSQFWTFVQEKKLHAITARCDV